MKNVTIIGAGVSGLSLGISLKKLGIESQIFETWPYERIEGSSFRMSQSGVYALKEVGVLDEIQKNSHSADYVRILTKENEEYVRINLFQSDKYEERSIFIQRSDVIEILTEKAKEMGVPIHYKKQLTHFEQDDQEVTAHFTDGTSVKSSLLIGADGLHSAVRHKMYDGHELEFLKFWGMYGVLSEQDIPEDILALAEGTENLYLGNGFNVMLSKTNPNNEWDYNWQSTGYIEEPLPVAEFNDLNQDELKNWLTTNYDISGSLGNMIKNTKSIIAKQIYTVSNLESLSKGRVAVIGDAAHGIDPHSGYGSSVAAEDAVYLANQLSKHEYSKAFYNFEHDRKERIQAIQEYAANENLSYGMDFDAVKKGGVYLGAGFDPNYKVKLHDNQ